ncbi:MAG: hypothetical protein GKS02_00035 [Alphaproteobacteria bacterium]|nr:hypothetical protein [Alphaproteobacteria bacterium]
MKFVLSAMVIAGGLLFATSASAHSFDTIFVVPVSGSQAQAGTQARDGFMFATRERDAHPNETADGHLGGLDVYLRLVDGNAAAADVVAKARELAGRAADDAPRIVAPAAILEALNGQTEGAELIVIDLTAPAPANMSTMDGRPFGAAFEAAFGYAPTPAVFAGYAAARQIDTVVRANN